LVSKTPTSSYGRGSIEYIKANFWQLWQQEREYLSRRCMKWMNGNRTEADEALSEATIKAWERVKNCDGSIANFKGWAAKLTDNLCKDILRYRSRNARRIESLEEIAVKEDEAVISSFDSPESEILRDEFKQFICGAVDALPDRLRTPFILRYYRQISYPDIAQQLAISPDTAYKRIQQARDILQKRLRRYLAGGDDSVLDFSETSGKKGKSVIKCYPSDELTSCDSQPASAVESIGETINYQVTASCRETLSHSWYRSLSPLGWS
jgi:RNA polymerase sigma factor (sigma-70 family)